MTIQQQAASSIERIVDDWRPRFLDLDTHSVGQKPSPSRWSIAEVLGHLVDSACNNHQRFVRAQFVEELTFPKYEQNEWVDAANYRESDWESLVQLWYFYNRQLATLIRNLPDSKLPTPCTITPYDTCTLEFLVTDYVNHLDHHLAIVLTRLDENA